MKKILVVSLAGILLIPALMASATRVSIGTGPWGGAYFLVGTALAHLLSKHIAGVSAIAEPVTGSAHGLELLDRGDVTVALVSLATAHFGVRGEREFDRAYNHVAFVMAAMDTGQSFVTLVDSGIKAFDDVKGLHVAANSPASKAQLLAVLKLYGVKEADVRLSLMNYTEQMSALRDGALDAGFIAVSPYNTDLAAFASAQPIRILSLDVAKAKAFEEPPFWAPVPVRRGTYPGQDRDLLVPGAHTALLAHKQADPMLIYQIVKTIIQRRDEFGDLHPGGREFTVAKTRSFVEQHLVPVAFHPGAARYWREQGVLK